VSADLVEFNPDRDVDHITASVAAKLLKEIAGKIIHQIVQSR
jgi:arginase family enzyme